jgi:hypothetical protein
MAVLVAVLLCVALVAMSELVRFGVARALRLPVRRIAKLFVVPRGPRPLRMLAIASGTVATYLAIVALASVLYSCGGMPTTRLECIIESIAPGYPAEGKLERGDKIIAIDGRPFEVSPSTLIDADNGTPVRFTFLRRGASHDVTLQPVGKDGHWVIGFRPQLVRARVFDTGLAVREAFAFPFAQAAVLLPAPRREFADPGGPKWIIDEYRIQIGPGEAALRLALLFSVYVLVLGFVADLVRCGLALGNDRDKSVA